MQRSLATMAIWRLFGLCRPAALKYFLGRNGVGDGPSLEELRMKLAIALLSTLAAGVTASAPALAQTSWSGGTPVFESDVRARAEATEAEREARRKAYPPVVYPKLMQGGEQPDIKPAEPPIVYFDQNEEPGSIIVDTAGKKLYYVLPGKKAYAYPISVGRDGFTWQGTEKISRIAAWPTWTPPPEMHKRIPGLPITVTGGLKNPQGARALYLGNTIYRIHGTNNDRSIGRANSSGCFRLTNEHVVHLASIAKVGTKVRVLQAYAGSVSEGAPLASLFSFGASEEPAKPVAKPKPKPAQKKAAPKKPAVAAAAPEAPAAPGATESITPAPVTPAPAAAQPAAASPVPTPAETPARPTTSE
jgi:lipoprotein-anchoring transpeptidase ErfK/SrfK